MAVTNTGVVGITSNPDARYPTDPSQVLTVPGNISDPKARDITINFGGRRPVTYVRDKNPYSPKGVS